ncbi:hypothetical protein WICPIJ_009834 [Wickerhamomyces pijperi]|uniref:Glycosyltransferase family 71 protein n=1 Tax=Wickerhamomyces pijperi TaxID=599730 RepID=A0A9P8PJS6_WICPI|nr:hypothetical protein WICPIJ_009834 [Wickerhamomyces pijperi]
MQRSHIPAQVHRLLSFVPPHRSKIITVVGLSLLATFIINFQLLDFSPPGPLQDFKLPPSRLPVPEKHQQEQKPASQRFKAFVDSNSPFKAKKKPQLPSSSLVNYTDSDFVITKEQEFNVPYLFAKIVEKYTPEYLISLTPMQKCHLVFDTAYELDSKWTLENTRETKYHRDTWKFFEKGSVIPEDKRPDLEAYRLENLKLERKQMEQLSYLRAYEHCYLNNPNDEEKDKFHERYDVVDMEMRLFPWITGNFPKFESWNNETYTNRSTILPVFDRKSHRNYVEKEKRKPVTFLETYKSQLNGKGYIVSVDDKHVTQLYQLIALLRALGNQLPIQVIHYGDLSAPNRQKAVKVARDVEGLHLEGVVDNLSKIMTAKKLSIDFQKENIEVLLPPQDLWFVDASGTIAKSHRRYFGGFYNKLIAYFFSSFKDILLVDTDTVPLVDLDAFVLQSPEFLEKGAFFFKDRELSPRISKGDSFLFKKYTPTKYDTFFLGAPVATNHTLNNRMIRNQHMHYMESGVVAVDKVRHFNSVLATLQISLFKTITDKIYGEKELFWLGFSINGDESYHMNKWNAGTVGSLAEGGLDHRVCSTHPAHLSSDDKTLLWINSGFVRCKFSNEKWEGKKDMQSKLWGLKSSFTSEFELQKFYSGYQDMKYLVIPGSQEDVGRDGWTREEECKGYVWCANNRNISVVLDSLLESYKKTLPKNSKHVNITTDIFTSPIIDGPDSRSRLELKNGLFVEFDKGQRIFNEYLGSVYDGTFRIFRLSDN